MVDGLVNLQIAVWSLILPPVGLWLGRGCQGKSLERHVLFANVGLTLCGFLPGIIHAFYVNFTVSEQEYQRLMANPDMGACGIL